MSGLFGLVLGKEHWEHWCVCGGEEGEGGFVVGTGREREGIFGFVYSYVWLVS